MVRNDDVFFPDRTWAEAFKVFQERQQEISSLLEIYNDDILAENTETYTDTLRPSSHQNRLRIATPSSKGSLFKGEAAW